MATPRLGLVVEDKPTELSCIIIHHCLAYITNIVIFCLIEKVHVST